MNYDKYEPRVMSDSEALNTVMSSLAAMLLVIIIALGVFGAMNAMSHEQAIKERQAALPGDYVNGQFVVRSVDR